MQIITRKEWSAANPRGELSKDVPHRLVIHHSATLATSWAGAKTVRAFQRYHVNECGMSDIAYHFVLSPDGSELYEGRPVWALGAHCGGSAKGIRHFGNRNSLGICVAGDYDKETPNPAMVKALTELIGRICQERSIKPDEVYGHCEALSPMPKTCPGRNLFIELFGKHRWDKLKA